MMFNYNMIVMVIVNMYIINVEMEEFIGLVEVRDQLDWGNG